MARRAPIVGLGIAALLLCVATASASPALRACVAGSCRRGVQACVDAFRHVKQQRLADCAGSTSVRACKRDARHAVGSGIRACQAAGRTCASCCKTKGAACLVGVCGNDRVEAGEACDGTAGGSCSGGCRADCTCATPPAACGNGVREGAEQCDGGDAVACPGRCSAACTCMAPPVVCGNGKREASEQCDGTDDAACPGRCTGSCVCAPPATCGDGMLDAGEECDGAWNAACEIACAPDCTCVPPVCGNGLLASTEDCEVGHDGACPGLCRGDCTCPPPVCGNGVVEFGEDCEPSVADSCASGCLPSCKCALCGDGIIDSPVETCEPGNDAACPGACSTISCNCLSPTTDVCEAPHQIDAFPVVDRESTTLATVAATDPVVSCIPPRADGQYVRSVWYGFTAPGTGRVRVDTLGSTFDSILAAYTGTCGAPSEVACVDDPLDVNRLTARIDFPVQAGVPYRVEVAAVRGTAGDDELKLSADFRPCGDGVVDPGEGCDPQLAGSCVGGLCSPKCECLDAPADECAAAAVATTLPVDVHVAAYAATANPGDPTLTCVSLPGPQSVWYRFRAPVTGTVTVSTAGSDYDTVMGVFSGPCGGLVPLACDDDGAGDYQSLAIVHVVAGTDYTVLVVAYGTDAPARLDLRIAY